MQTGNAIPHPRQAAAGWPLLTNSVRSGMFVAAMQLDIAARTLIASEMSNQTRMPFSCAASPLPPHRRAEKWILAGNQTLSRLLALICLCPLLSIAQPVVVFTNSFDGTLPPEFQPGVATNTPVQGYSGLGPAGNRFGGSFLRSPTGNLVILTLTNLPPHTALNLSMLFAAIDSLDGTGAYPSGDFFRVTLGTSYASNVVFRESFANALPQQIQSYVPPPGAELARHVDLGFSGPGSYYTDSAYNFTVDSRFSGLAHYSSEAVLTFQIEGPGIQPLDDESWAMENLSVSLVPVEPPLITQVQMMNSNVQLTWTAVSNITYLVQYRNDLQAASWTDLPPAVTATNVTADFAEPISQANRFYRIKVVAP